MLAAVALVALVVARALAAPTSLLPRETDIEATDRLLFEATIAEFAIARAAKTPATLDWASDGCSSSPDEPLEFGFTPSCYRHDFGYRNYKKQSRFDEVARKRIDDKFKKDLYAQCESEWSEFICKIAANVYYAAVRAFGGTQAVQHVKEIREALKALEALQERHVEVRGVKALEDVGERS